MIATITHRHGLSVDQLYPDIYKCSFISWVDGENIIADLDTIQDLQELAQVLDQPVDCDFTGGDYDKFVIVID